MKKEQTGSEKISGSWKTREESFKESYQKYKFIKCKDKG